VLRFFRFYKPTFLRAIPILWVAADRYVTGLGLVSSALAFFSPELARSLPGILPEISRWWALVPLVLLFVYGFLRALQERFEGLEEKLASAKKRKAINDHLGNALEEGLSLKQGRIYALESENQELEDIEIGDEYQARYDEEVRAWVDRTYELIDDALGRAQAQRFISNEGYTDQELLRGSVNRRVA
jgi:hypothetical protein